MSRYCSDKAFVKYDKNNAKTTRIYSRIWRVQSAFALYASKRLLFFVIIANYFPELRPALLMQI